MQEPRCGANVHGREFEVTGLSDIAIAQELSALLECNKRTLPKLVPADTPERIW
jgi:hypothetical protein